MPGLGPGIHEFPHTDAEIAVERAIPGLWVSLFLCNSWMPGPSPGMTVERLRAHWRCRTAPGLGVLLRRSRVAAYPILTPMGLGPGIHELPRTARGGAESRRRVLVSAFSAAPRDQLVDVRPKTWH